MTTLIQAIGYLLAGIFTLRLLCNRKREEVNSYLAHGIVGGRLITIRMLGAPADMSGQVSNSIPF